MEQVRRPRTSTHGIDQRRVVRECDDRSEGKSQAPGFLRQPGRWQQVSDVEVHQSTSVGAPGDCRVRSGRRAYSAQGRYSGAYRETGGEVRVSAYRIHCVSKRRPHGVRGPKEATVGMSIDIQPSEEVVTGSTGETKGPLHVYGQFSRRGPAAIVGSRAALMELREAIDKALQTGAASLSACMADGE